MISRDWTGIGLGWSWEGLRESAGICCIFTLCTPPSLSVPLLSVDPLRRGRSSNVYIKQSSLINYICVSLMNGFVYIMTNGFMWNRKNVGRIFSNTSNTTLLEQDINFQIKNSINESFLIVSSVDNMNMYTVLIPNIYNRRLM